MDQTLSSIALLSTFYEEGKNYFDVYLPFIIKSCPDVGTVDLSEIGATLRASFGFELPINVTKTILAENANSHFDLRKDSRANWDVSLTQSGRLLRSTLLDDEASAELDLHRLIDNLRAYLEEFTGEEQSVTTTRQQVERFFRQNIDAFSIRRRSVGSSRPQDSFSRHFVQYLRSIGDADPKQIQVVERIWKGMVLLDEMVVNPQKKRVGSITQRIEVFIDTNIVFSLLGLHNQVLNKAVQELFTLIAKLPKIKVFVLDTTICEFERILSAYLHVKDSFQEIEVDSVFYFMKKNGYDSTKILQLRENIVDELRKKDVDYRETETIDESILSYYPRIRDMLLENRKEKNDRLPLSQRRSDQAIERSAHHDAYAVSYILRSKNKKTKSIHACKAVFLTSSTGLCDNYSRITKQIEGFPAVIKDINFTNLLYIINPEKGTGPTLEHILAAHSNVLFVDSRLWAEYISRLEAMLYGGSIGANDYALLVSNNKAVLAYLSNADADTVRQDDIAEVLESVRSERRQLEEKYGESESERGALKNELSRKDAEITNLRAMLAERELRERQQEYEGRMEKSVDPQIRKSVWRNVLTVFLYSVFVAGAIFIFSLNQSLRNGILSIVLFIVPFITSLIRHENVLRSVRIVFSRKYRRQFKQMVRERLKDDYLHEHPIQ